MTGTYENANGGSLRGDHLLRILTCPGMTGEPLAVGSGLVFIATKERRLAIVLRCVFRGLVGFSGLHQGVTAVTESVLLFDGVYIVGGLRTLANPAVDQCTYDGHSHHYGHT